MLTVEVAGEGAQSRANGAAQDVVLGNSGGEGHNGAGKGSRDGDEDGGGTHICCVVCVLFW